MSEHFVYILKELDGKRTYVGYTNNLKNRLRKHNGEIKGGAKYTSGRKWEIAAYISGFPNNILGLQCEWRLKNPYGKGKRGESGIIGRLEGLKHVMETEKFTSNSAVDILDLDLVLFIKKEYMFIFENCNYKVSEIESSS